MEKIKKKFNTSKREPRFDSKNDPLLRGRRLHSLTEDDDVQPDGNLVEYKLVRPFVGKIRWGFLIVDEAHIAKRVDSIYNHMFRLLNWRNLVWVTGTPLMSGLIDILSPLSLMWPKFGLEMPFLLGHDIDYLEGLWRDEYDPFAEVKKFLERDIRIWQIDPHLVERVGRAAQWSSSFGKDVISVVLKVVSLRRTLQSRLVLPDGEVCFPASGLQPMKIVTEELTFDKKRRAVVLQYGRVAATNTFPVPSGALQHYIASQEGITASGREGSINFSAYREGILVAFDCRNIKILYEDVGHIFGPDVGNMAKALANVRDSRQPLTETQRSRLIRRATKDDQPTVGVEHLQKLLSFDNNAGLSYYFSRACLDPDVIAPAERLVVRRMQLAEMARGRPERSHIVRANALILPPPIQQIRLGGATWLAYEEGRLRKTLEDKLGRSIRQIKVKEEEREKKEKLSLLVQARQAENLSQEFIGPGDSELEDEDLGEMDEEADDEQPTGAEDLTQSEEEF
ncbi:hypothetical protein V8C35DRAFT_284402 [Trichoderma chlorosporum]